MLSRNLTVFLNAAEAVLAEIRRMDELDSPVPLHESALAEVAALRDLAELMGLFIAAEGISQTPMTQRKAYKALKIHSGTLHNGCAFRLRELLIQRGEYRTKTKVDTSHDGLYAQLSELAADMTDAEMIQFIQTKLPESRIVRQLEPPPS